MEDIRQTVAEQIDQRHVRIVERQRRHVVALRRERLIALLMRPELRIREGHRRHAGRLVGTRRVLSIAGHRDSGEKREEGVGIVVIVEIGRANERRAAKFGEVVEHQDPAAAPKRADLEPCAEVGKAIFADRDGIVF